MRNHPPVTSESIAAAKAAQRVERALVTAQTGLVITADGRVVLPRHPAKRPKRWYCEMCDRWFMSRVDCPRCGLALLRAH